MNEQLYKIIKDNEKLIYKLANKFYGVDKEDLYQVGVIGLIKAYHNYKASGAKFTTYAYEYIFGEMYNLALASRTIKVNKDTLKMAKKIEEARIFLTQKLKKIPTNYDLATFLGLEQQVINNVLTSTADMLSLDEDTNVNLYKQELAEVNIDEQIIINDSMVVLNEKEKNVIDYRYFKEFTQNETATFLGMTQASVSRYEKRGLEKMNNYLTN